MQNTQDMQRMVRDYIVTHLIRNPKFKLVDTDPLISGGLVDSFALVELAMFLESEFGVRPDDADLNVTHMDTVEMIVNYVQSHR